MEICMECGAMISPYPMHKEKLSICDECAGVSGHNPVDHSRPKIKGKHMIIEKPKEQIEIEKRQRQRMRGF